MSYELAKCCCGEADLAAGSAVPAIRKSSRRPAAGEHELRAGRLNSGLRNSQYIAKDGKGKSLRAW